MNEFDKKVLESTGERLRGADIDTFQVNVGLVCNLECVHCHVSSSPRRKEEMDWQTMELVLSTAKRCNAKLIDITGGAPEMNPNFRRFVTAAREEGFTVKVRTNLTILLEPGYVNLPEFFRAHKVQLDASMPCYLQDNVDKQRGGGVYDGSITALKRLNGVGYGVDPALPLNLVYNPGGPHLPPSQAALEDDYRRELRERFGIVFTSLHTITNMPIGRYRVDLRHAKKEDGYMQLLHDSFNPATLDGLMCRHQVNIDWEGNLYDCDFNLAMKKRVDSGVPNHIRDFDEHAFVHRQIVTADYCFGCTAGCGSSCGGALLVEENLAV